jgi:hypothetical protein
MEAKIWAEIDTIREKMDKGEETMKAQMGCHTPPIDVNCKEMKAIIKADLEEMEGAAQISQKELKVRDFEVNPKATEAIAE